MALIFGKFLPNWSRVKNKSSLLILQDPSSSHNHTSRLYELTIQNLNAMYFLPLSRGEKELLVIDCLLCPKIFNYITSFSLYNSPTRKILIFTSIVQMWKLRPWDVKWSARILQLGITGAETHKVHALSRTPLPWNQSRWVLRFYVDCLDLADFPLLLKQQLSIATSNKKSQG